MAKYYTSRGDQGETDQIGKGRLSKTHIRIRAVGALDEASAFLGFARAQSSDPDLNQLIKSVQMDLYRIMSIAAQEVPDPEKIPDLDPERLAWLEKKTDLYSRDIESPRGFILPGDTLISGAFSLARTVVRRAERELVALSEAGYLDSETVLAYMNRLSSFCFVLELSAAQSPPNKTGLRS